MKKKKDEASEPAPPAPADSARSSDKDSRPLNEKIGFAKLDLSIEEVEERISPRETNVFDK